MKHFSIIFYSIIFTGCMANNGPTNNNSSLSDNTTSEETSSVDNTTSKETSSSNSSSSSTSSSEETVSSSSSTSSSKETVSSSSSTSSSKETVSSSSSTSSSKETVSNYNSSSTTSKSNYTNQAPACIPVDGVTNCQDSSQCCQSGTGIGVEGAMCIVSSGKCQAACQNDSECNSGCCAYVNNSIYGVCSDASYCVGYSGACYSTDGQYCNYYYNMNAPINCAIDENTFGQFYNYQSYCPINSYIVNQVRTVVGNAVLIRYTYN